MSSMLVRLLHQCLLVALCASAGPGPAAADWLSSLARLGERAAVKGAAKGGSALERAAAGLKALPAGAKGAALAAHVSQEGHWTFVNRAGERFTAGTPDEMKRAATILSRDRATTDGQLMLVLTEDSVFAPRGHLNSLPRDAALRIADGSSSVPLVRIGNGAASRLYAELRPGLLLEATAQPMFKEARWQLSRPLKRAGIRVLGLQPGGPQTLRRTPRIDPATKRALTDVVDPARLPAALVALRGQTAILTGRLDSAGRLHYRLGSGTERSLAIAEILRGAERADVNLIILRSPTPRQPGGRNWLWQRVSVDGLDDALKRATVADFLAALGRGQSRLLVTASKPVAPRVEGRVMLRAVPVSGPSLDPGLGSSLGNLFSEIVSEVAGQVVTSGIEASLVDANRQRELDARIVPGISSDLQIGYIVCFVLGLVGLGNARSWWRRLWPPEQRLGYAGPVGFWAARSTRFLAFLFLFMPLVGPLAGPIAIVRNAFDNIVGLAMIATWPIRALYRALAGNRA